MPWAQHTHAALSLYMFVGEGISVSMRFSSLIIWVSCIIWRGGGCANQSIVPTNLQQHWGVTLDANVSTVDPKAATVDTNVVIDNANFVTENENHDSVHPSFTTVHANVATTHANLFLCHQNKETHCSNFGSQKLPPPPMQLLQFGPSSSFCQYSLLGH